MNQYKIYRKDNYIFIVQNTTQETQYGFTKEVFIDKSNVNVPAYRIFNVKDFSDTISLNISQILKEDGSPYTQTEFETFYTQNTGNFNQGGSGQGVQTVTGGAVDNTDPANPVINATEEAPEDGQIYGRKDGDWEVIVSGGVQSVSGSTVNNSDPLNPIILSTDFQNEITALSTTFNSSQKGDYKMFTFNNSSNQTLTINSGIYVKNDVINIERRGLGELEIIQGAGVRFRGVRTIDNRFFVGDPNTMVSLLCRGAETFSIIGNLRRGGAAVTVSSYDDLIYTDVNKSVNVYGTGFSPNMIVTITGNATQVTPFTYVNNNQITLHLTSTGAAGNAITVTYDNGDIFQDTNAIILLSSALTYVSDSNPFSFGYALFKLTKTQVYGLQVRRDSDNAIVDVKFDSAGKISLSSFVSTGVTLGTWAGTSNVFIVTKYNQGTAGGNYNLTQSDTTKQAKLLNAGALIVQGSRTLAEFDGTNDAYSTPGNDNWCSGNLHVFADVRSKTLANGVLCGYFPAAARITERLLMFRFDSTGIINANSVNEAGTSTAVNSGAVVINTNYNTVFSRNATNQIVYLNGVAGTPATALTAYPSESKPIEHGASIDDLNANFLNGYNNYLIIYKIDNRASITSIQNIINTYL